ncbi:hypothetical protein AGMMS49545_11250 [Betaproteobacteria bacterium]|nr:hypothetical protein AGMMS49545_11250 [Betaproteobacteria bacterium]GHU44496.1 hypothetical protein AGMMS50289_12920 [Betaproteobacteria bacterium]
MSVQDFLKKINRKNQKFQCFVCDDDGEALNLTVAISNQLNPPAAESDLLKIKSLIPNGNEEIVDFYKIHNGISLFCNKETKGIELFSIDDLERQNEGWKDWTFGMVEDEDELYDFEKYGVAFGEISQSGNYFILYEGKVFYFDHDGGGEDIIGESFNDFLLKIVENPPGFLRDMGCYTRYEDDAPNPEWRQWIPKVFVFDEE